MAMACPIPELPPVTTATFPCKPFTRRSLPKQRPMRCCPGGRGNVSLVTTKRGRRPRGMTFTPSHPTAGGQTMTVELAPARESLHRLAEHVLAAAQARAGAGIRLRYTKGGLETLVGLPDGRRVGIDE